MGRKAYRVSRQTAGLPKYHEDVRASGFFVPISGRFRGLISVKKSDSSHEWAVGKRRAIAGGWLYAYPVHKEEKCKNTT